MTYTLINPSVPACPRCPCEAMIWVKSSWQCPQCQFKEGCCG